MPSPERYSRVPSVAKISTSRSRRSRASAATPSRLATDSRARTRAFLLRRRALGVGGAPVGGAAARPSIASVMAYSGRRPTDPIPSEVRVTLAPWDYLFLSFNSRNFPDLFHPTWIASLVLLVVLLVLYNRRTQALHRHQPYVDLWEWLWWTGLITFSLLLIESVFVFSSSSCWRRS